MTSVVLAFSTEDDTGTVLFSAVPILAECHYWNIRDSSVCIGMTIPVLAFLTEDDTGTGLFVQGRYRYWHVRLRTMRVLAFLTEDDTCTHNVNIDKWCLCSTIILKTLDMYY